MLELRRLRVVTADDSSTVRLLLRQTLSPEHGFDVVGEARNGQECLDLVDRLKPDIVVLDVDMPVMDGVEATRRIMQRSPTPILIFTSSALAHRSRVPIEALAAGALDVFAKPGGGSEAAFRAAAEEFRNTLRLLAPIKVIGRPLLPGSPRTGSRAAPAESSPAGPPVVAIAASTGGPVAVMEVLGSLPQGLPAAILLVQHMTVDFMPGFCQWLGDNVPLPVQSAEGGESLKPGVVFVAPGGKHLRLGPDGRLRLDDSPPRHSCRPSADVLFESVAEAAPPRSVGVLLTGMGQDGAAGLLRLRRAGAMTIAQDQATSVIFGMPRAAIELGAAEKVLPLKSIGPALARHLESALPS